jgi:hypothetical protein
MPANRTAIVSKDTTVLAGAGHGCTLPAGRYAVVDIDGASERGVAYLEGPDGGALVCVNTVDPNITYGEG